MMYVRVEDCFVCNDEILYYRRTPNNKAKSIRVPLTPLNAKEGDTFGCGVIQATGKSRGVLYVPQDRFHKEFLPGEHVETFNDFEDARQDALEIMAVAAVKITPHELRNMPADEDSGAFREEAARRIDRRFFLDKDIVIDNIAEQMEDVRAVFKQQAENPRSFEGYPRNHKRRLNALEKVMRM